MNILKILTAKREIGNIGEQAAKKFLRKKGYKILECNYEAAGYEIASAEKDKIPSNYVTLDNEEDIKFMGLLIEKLEDDDDVMNIYHNWENCD